MALDFLFIKDIISNVPDNASKAPTIAVKDLPISSQDIVDNIFRDDATIKIANDMLINDNIVDSEPLLILLILFNIAIAPRTAVKLITIADIELYKFSVLIDARTKIDAASIDIAKDILNILFIFIPVHRYSNESFKL